MGGGCGACGDVFVFLGGVAMCLTNLGGVFGYWVAVTFKGKSPRWSAGTLFLLSAFLCALVAKDAWALCSGCRSHVDLASAESRKPMAWKCLIVWAASAVFFALIANNFGLCLHEGCVPDWVWSIVNVIICAVWLAF